MTSKELKDTMWEKYNRGVDIITINSDDGAIIQIEDGFTGKILVKSYEDLNYRDYKRTIYNIFDKKAKKYFEEYFATPFFNRI